LTAETLPAARRTAARRWSRRLDSTALPWLLLLPALLVILGLVAYPIIETFWLSFHAGTGVSTGPFVGADQYRSLFADPGFRAALLRTALFSVFNGADAGLYGAALLAVQLTAGPAAPPAG
jgi:N,N'-diacetylchitobiose transport system permease protein